MIGIIVLKIIIIVGVLLCLLALLLFSILPDIRKGKRTEFLQWVIKEGNRELVQKVARDLGLYHATGKLEFPDYLLSQVDPSLLGDFIGSILRTCTNNDPEPYYAIVAAWVEKKWYLDKDINSFFRGMDERNPDYAEAIKEEVNIIQKEKHAEHLEGVRKDLYQQGIKAFGRLPS